MRAKRRAAETKLLRPSRNPKRRTKMRERQNPRKARARQKGQKRARARRQRQRPKRTKRRRKLRRKRRGCVQRLHLWRRLQRRSPWLLQRRRRDQQSPRQRNLWHRLLRLPWRLRLRLLL